MKYFTVHYLTQKTLHPNGHIASTEYVCAETKADAKIQSVLMLRDSIDPANWGFYKSPRLEEMTEDAYIVATTAASATSEADVTLMLIAMFGEDDEYNDNERRDALALLENPDDEPEKYAEYLALCASGEVSTELSQNAVSKSVDAGAEVAVGGIDTDCAELVENRTTEASALDALIARALSYSKAALAEITDGDYSLADKRVADRSEDFVAWSKALHAVLGIGAYSDEQVIDCVQAAHVDVYLGAGALGKHITDFFAFDGDLDGLATEVAETEKMNGVGLAHSSETAYMQEATTIRQPDGADINAELTEIQEAAIGADFVDEGSDDRSTEFINQLEPVNGRVEYCEEVFTGGDAVTEINAQLATLRNGESLILADLPNDTYHACDGYSSTQIRLFQQGGLSALQWLKDAPREAVSSLSVGTMTHAAILEPILFGSQYTVAPDAPRNTKEGKAAHAEFEAQCEKNGKTPVSTSDYTKVCAMRDSALANPTLPLLLQNGVSELSVFYRTEEGLLLKVRPDWFGAIDGLPFLLDIKTTADIHDFGKSVEQYGYHVQQEFYRWVMAQVFGQSFDFIFFAIGSSRECGRYPVLPCYLEEEDGTVGRLAVSEALSGIIESEKLGSQINIGTVSRPWWAQNADRRQREMLTQESSQIAQIDAEVAA
jgi:hypothetical protein